jgi:hypothetical protein
MVYNHDRGKKVVDTQSSYEIKAVMKLKHQYIF